MVALVINQHYHFSVHANAVLGVKYRNARLVSLLDYHTALKFANVVLLHKQVYPYLPSETLADQTKYTYYLFKVDGRDVVLADVWIRHETVVLSDGVTRNISLQGVSAAEMEIITEQLRLLGINFTMN